MTRKKLFFGSAAVLLFAALCAAPLLMAGCSSLLNAAGRALDGSAFREKTLARYISEGPSSSRVEVRVAREMKTGAEILLITTAALPEMTLAAAAPGPEGTAPLQSLRFLCSNGDGWNEFTIDIAGEVFFASASLIGERYRLRIREAPEAGSLTEAAARYKSARLSGEAALKSLENRRERVLALTAWMKSLPDAPPVKTRAEFEALWKPRLLPELAGAKRRPPGWETPEDNWRREGDVKWNLSYTGRFFPEDLRSLRDSGALARDWEEASAWIYLEYNWNGIFESFQDIEVIKR